MVLKITADKVENLIIAFCKMYDTKVDEETIKIGREVIPIMARTNSNMTNLGYCLAKSKTMALIFKPTYYDADIKVVNSKEEDLKYNTSEFFIEGIKSFKLEHINIINMLSNMISGQGNTVDKMLQVLSPVMADVTRNNLSEKIPKLTEEIMEQAYKIYGISQATSGYYDYNDLKKHMEKYGLEFDETKIKMSSLTLDKHPVGFGKIAQVIEFGSVRLGISLIAESKSGTFDPADKRDDGNDDDEDDDYDDNGYNNNDDDDEDDESKVESIDMEMKIRNKQFTIRTILANEKDSAYDYIDEGRLIFWHEGATNRPIFFDELSISTKEIMALANNCYALGRTVSLQDIVETLPTIKAHSPANATIVLVDDTNIHSIIDLTIKTVETKESTQQIKKVKNQKITEMARTVTTKKSLDLEGMKFYSDRFVYEDITIAPGKGIMSDLIREVRDNRDNGWQWGETGFNANGVTHKLFKYVENDFNKNDKTHIRVNGIDLILSKKTTTNDRVMYYINGIRVNTSEIYQLLQNSVCNKDIEKFETLLREVSKFSLRMRQYMMSGIDIDLNSEPIDERTCRIKFTREKNRNHFLVGEETEPLKDTNSLISLDGGKARNSSKMRTRFDLVNLLITKYGLSGDFAIDVVKEGINAYKETTKRSKEFLANTVKMTKAEEGTFKGKKGYFVLGSKRKYFIDEQSLRVYNAETGSAFCIVEGSLSPVVHLDKLAGRMLAVFNDSAIQGEINTL